MKSLATTPVGFPDRRVTVQIKANSEWAAAFNRGAG